MLLPATHLGYRIHLGAVKEVHSGLHALVQQAAGLRIGAPLAEQHGAEAERGHVQVSAAEPPGGDGAASLLMLLSGRCQRAYQGPAGGDGAALLLLLLLSERWRLCQGCT